MSRNKRPAVSPEEQAVLDHLQVRPLTSPEDLARCDPLIVEEHYLHDATGVGEHLRYVATSKGRWLAVAVWDAAAFPIKVRDHFIGWTVEQQCRQRRPLLANHTCLPVLEGCPDPNLVSKFMKLMLARLSQDWHERWGHPLARVERFVDPQLYQGTAYQVSGWVETGTHRGLEARGR